MTTETPAWSEADLAAFAAADHRARLASRPPEPGTTTRRWHHVTVELTPDEYTHYRAVAVARGVDFAGEAAKAVRAHFRRLDAPPTPEQRAAKAARERMRYADDINGAGTKARERARRSRANMTSEQIQALRDDPAYMAQQRANTAAFRARAQATRPTAGAHGLPWTFEDDREAQRTDLGVREISLRLGRTYDAVAYRRKQLRRRARA